MFSQNLVSGRDLFSSNPCRDFWDSQQFSQAASGSQSSQQSSVELFSQSKCSQSQQQKINATGCDWWSNTGNSQQMNEDEPVKYYMKYLSKPPIFSEQSRKDQEKVKPENFKDFIEIQKTKTLERDQRDLLDTFIGLLKDYTKEIQTAMKTFEASLGNSVSTNNTTFERMSSVAEKSFSVVDELKKDFDNRFDNLKEELKEKEELTSVILKKEQDMAKRDLEIELLKKQIEEFKRREEDALRREEKYKQREDHLLDTIKEAERHFGFKDTPPPSQHQDLTVLQRNERRLLAETGLQTSKPCCSKKDMVPNHQHTLSSSHPVYASSDIEFLEHFCTNTNRNIHSIRDKTYPMQNVLQKLHHANYLVDDNGSTCRCIPSLPNAMQCVTAQMGDNTQNFSEINASIYQLPTTTSVSIASVQKSGSSTQCLPLAKSYSGETQKHLSTSFPITVEKQNEAEPLKTVPSPANRLSVLTKDKWPRHSPVATVLPQVQVIKQSTSQDQCLSEDKKQQEDPFGIFIFDLTASTNFENSEAAFHPDSEPVVKQEQTDESPVKTTSSVPKKRQKKVPEIPLRKYGTRSRGKIEENENISIEKGVSQISSKNSNQSNNSSSKAIAGIKRKAPSSVGANNKKKCDIGITASTKPDANVIDLKIDENNRVESQVLQEISGSSFKRQRLEKRTLNLAGSSLFESVDEDISLEQIKESIRKHVQKRKLIRQNYGS